MPTINTELIPDLYQMPNYYWTMLYVTVFLFGIIIGSFLNVCIYRIPAKESIVPDSHCMSCQHRLYWYDLFPVFSYMFLKGRCRYCGTKVSIQYPLIETLNGVLYLLVFSVHGFNVQSILYCLMTSALIVIGVVSKRHHRIPLSLNIFLLCVGIAACILDYGRLVEHLIGMVCASLTLFLFYLIFYKVIPNKIMIRGDDILLMAVTGLILGWQRIFIALGLGCICGAAGHVICLKAGRNAAGDGKKKYVFVMGMYLSAAVYICALLK